MRFLYPWFANLLIASIFITGCAADSQETPAVSPPTEAAVSIFAPSPAITPAPTGRTSATSQPVPTSVNELPGVELPPGFSITLFAKLDSHPTSLAFDQHGNLFATFVDSSVRVLLDYDKDGRADEIIIFVNGYYLPLGVAIHPISGDVYLSSQGRITVFQDLDGDYVADTNTTLVDNLPFGLHQNDNLKFGPDDMLYIGVGSTCDACAEIDARSGTILKINPGSKTISIYARGLRNPYDLAFHPLTGDMFATDNGRDDLGMDSPFEELNHIVEGGNYGWPDCWNSLEGFGCSGVIQAVGFFEAHSSANSLDFYVGERFPDEYSYNLFVAIFGSWLKPNVQTGIMRVILTPDGDTYKTEISWFAKLPEGVMPLGLTIGPDGALYFGDYLNDNIYRISYGAP